MLPITFFQEPEKSLEQAIYINLNRQCLFEPDQMLVQVADVGSKTSTSLNTLQ